MKLRGEKPLSSKIIEIDKQKEKLKLYSNLIREKKQYFQTDWYIQKKNKDVSMEMKQIEEIKNKINTLKS